MLLPLITLKENRIKQNLLKSKYTKVVLINNEVNESFESICKTPAINGLAIKLTLYFLGSEKKINIPKVFR